jgi:hypothetical protein
MASSSTHQHRSHGSHSLKVPSAPPRRRSTCHRPRRSGVAVWHQSRRDWRQAARPPLDGHTPSDSAPRLDTVTGGHGRPRQATEGHRSPRRPQLLGRPLPGEQEGRPLLTLLSLPLPPPDLPAALEVLDALLRLLSRAVTIDIVPLTWIRTISPKLGPGAQFQGLYWNNDGM